MDKKGKNGQSTVEFALLFPLLLLITVLIIEVSLLFHNYLIVTQLSREAARAVALGSKTDEQIITDITTNTSWLVNTHFLVGEISEVSILPVAADREQGTNTTVSILYRIFIDAPFFGTATGLTMTAVSTMRME